MGGIDKRLKKECDPALPNVREGNAQTLALIFILIAAAVSALLKRRVEKP
ncbi:hypothetical protein [Leptothrix ochracea]